MNKSRLSTDPKRRCPNCDKEVRITLNAVQNHLAQDCQDSRRPKFYQLKGQCRNGHPHEECPQGIACTRRDAQLILLMWGQQKAAAKPKAEEEAAAEAKADAKAPHTRTHTSHTYVCSNID